MINSRIQYLIDRLFQNNLTATENLELAEWLQHSCDDEALRKLLEEKWAGMEATHSIAPGKADEILAGILQQSTGQNVVVMPVRRSINWRKFSVAASIILILGAGLVYQVTKKSNADLADKKVAPKHIEAPVKNDIDPGKTGAVLTLADGTKMVLDDSPDGTLAVQGNAQVINSDGGLVYNSGDATNEMLYNTLTTNRGEHFPLKLADGTKIWLNSASSIRFPVSFITNERIVEITGEAYFEVAKDASRPFKVRLNGMEVKVLGTHFNINGYADESNIETTLLEGSVLVTKGPATLQLAPGQQSRISHQGQMTLIKDADIEEAVSWKDGYFHFKNADLETVLRNIARWYDVDIVYAQGSKKKEQFFSGDIQKTLTLSSVLRILDESQVNFKIENKNLIVLP